MAAKKKTGKKKSFVLSDEELDKVSGGSGPAVSPAARIGSAVRGIQITKGLPNGGIGAEPYDNREGRPTPMRINRASIPGTPGGNNM